MPIVDIDYGTFDDDNDLSVNTLQQININMDVAYDELIAKGRGIVDYVNLLTNVDITSMSSKTPTIIGTANFTLVPGRMYRIAALLDTITADSDVTLETRQFMGINVNDQLLRYKYFYTPRTPDLESLFIPNQIENKIDIFGVLIQHTSSPTIWTCDFTNWGMIYAEDLGDPKGLSLE